MGQDTAALVVIWGGHGGGAGQGEGGRGDVGGHTEEHLLPLLLLLFISLLGSVVWCGAGTVGRDGESVVGLVE